MEQAQLRYADFFTMLPRMQESLSSSWLESKDDGQVLINAVAGEVQEGVLSAKLGSAEVPGDELHTRAEARGKPTGQRLELAAYH